MIPLRSLVVWDFVRLWDEMDELFEFEAGEEVVEKRGAGEGTSESICSSASAGTGEDAEVDVEVDVRDESLRRELWMRSGRLEAESEL